MRRFIPYIACGLLLVSGWACTRTDDMDIPSANQDKIVIKTTLDPHVVTRATVADEEAERKITRIDVFVVDPTTDNIAYRQTYTSTNGALNNSGAENGNGTLTLGAERSLFTANKEYNVYLVANAPAAIVQKLDEKVKGSDTEYVIETLGELKTLVHEAFTSTKSVDKVTGEESTTKHTLLHLSGTTHPTDPTKQPPQTFMMDAVATTSSSTSKAVVLNDGVTTNNTSLVAEFKRAAAKIVVNIKQGASVQFERYLLNNKDVSEGSAEYVFYNLPTETPILADAEALLSDNNTLIETDSIVLPQKEAGQKLGVSYPTFIWKDNVGSVNAEGKGDVKIQIVGYAYAHNWENKPTLNFEPSLLLCLPMYWDANKDLSDGKETMRPGNWYKVPLSQEKKFERNTCYEVNITINAVGAESKSEAIELDDIDYDTRPWEVTTIEIGDDTTTPKYLKLNTDLVKMYNTNIDTEQLIFSSSSPITSIVLKDVYRHDMSTNTFIHESGKDFAAYYLNKYNVQKPLDQLTTNTISATAEWGKLNGVITILSPIMRTTQEERRIALAALGEEPIVPQEPSSEGKPLLSEYVPKNSFEGERPAASAEYYQKTYYEYRYNESTNTIQYNTFTCGRSYYSGSYHYYWSDRSGKNWINMANPTEYENNLAEWLDNNPEYREYQNAIDEKAAYDAAVSAIANSENADESHYNTVRYLEFEVRNQEGLTATFRVEQYPTIYITNAVGWYSYRDDFKNVNSSSHATTYHIKGDGISAISYVNGEYKLSKTSTSGCFWYSKVSNTPEQSHQGPSDWDFYYWQDSSNSATKGSGTDDENTRMYNIQVTTTSEEYTIGVPKRVNVTQTINYGGTQVSVTYDTTEDSEANARLVSPSFMTASRLGVVTTSNIDYTYSSGENFEKERYNLFSYHCSNYVEVKQVVVDGVTKKVVYDDWRLPTAAEIGIIINLQSTNKNDETKAIDYLLNAGYYYSASGPVKNQNDETSVSVRCVRDAVNEPAPKDLTSK